MWGTCVIGQVPCWCIKSHQYHGYSLCNYSCMTAYKPTTYFQPQPTCLICFLPHKCPSQSGAIPQSLPDHSAHSHCIIPQWICGFYVTLISECWLLPLGAAVF